ncbi:helix-turn-helix domain-containing protein [Nocardia sp. CDC159]|uniref:Helix-turn-helix domain-containing protein n=1 Tax=Nocardia pulmonis TaxID=2951408 RepID=A0A9X2E6K7_9NOCA|nr:MULTISPECIES: helix-turn-helix transcriptional regulator [Nocardia]MCM6773760.1 helix-turn-helix domain-containing protein [Nocardia pulmonis]MCM6786647.1 helix-turn-helix domain-containing protein [Nocardia sp. CDC159]
MGDTNPKRTVSGPEVPRRQLGRLLRDLRQGAGLTIARVAELIECGTATVQRLETAGTQRIDLNELEAFCRVCGADDHTVEALRDFAQGGSEKGWFYNFELYLGLEAMVESLTMFAEIMPGLLQTADYARFLFQVGHPDESPSQIERRVEMRMRRKRSIVRKGRPVRLDAVVDEMALRRVIGDRRIMRAQCRHLADMSTRPNITVRILPFSAGLPVGEVTGPLIIMDFGSRPGGEPLERSLVYVENYRGAMYYDDKDEVKAYRATHEAMVRAALCPDASRALLRQAAREYSA